jgi:hypothetical protein
MRRRDFLWMGTCAALAAVSPVKKYFIGKICLQDEFRLQDRIFLCGSPKPKTLYWSKQDDPDKWEGFVDVTYRFYRESGEVFYSVEGGEFREIPNFAWHGKIPFVEIKPLSMFPWLQSDERIGG